ncbi:MAG: gamma-glutamyltransferase, partial [Dongiaceae bacterium]
MPGRDPAGSLTIAQGPARTGDGIIANKTKSGPAIGALVLILTSAGCAAFETCAPVPLDDETAAEAARADPEPAFAVSAAGSIVAAERQMIVAAHPLASEAGLAMLRNGGSAIDAAIAAQLVLNLVEPQSSGIGGGGFLLYFDAAKDRTLTYDGRETAPMGASETMFLDVAGNPL